MAAAHRCSRSAPAVQWIQRIERRRRGRSSPAGRSGVVDVVADTTASQLRSIGEHIDGLAVMVLLLVAFISLLVQIYSLEYVRGDRRYTHFFAAITLFSRRHAGDGPRREHGPADPRLGDHGPLLVPAHRALVGGGGQRPRRAEGVLHRARRRRRPARRHGDPVFGANSWTRSTSASPASASAASRRGRCPARPATPCCCGPRSRCSSPASARAASSRCTPGCPTPWPARRRCRRCCTPRRWSSPACSSSPASTRCSSEGFDDRRRQRSTSSSSIAAITIVISGAAGVRAERHQEGARLLDRRPARLHDARPRRRAWLPAVFHIFTHAFFKCCLFLCAGSVSHSGSHHSFDMKKDMGGLREEDADHRPALDRRVARARRHVPVRRVLLQGRDHRQRRPQRLRGVHVDRAWSAPFLTAAYTVRATYLTFFGEPRGAAAGEHRRARGARRHEVAHHGGRRADAGRPTRCTPSCRPTTSAANTTCSSRCTPATTPSDTRAARVAAS